MEEAMSWSVMPKKFLGQNVEKVSVRDRMAGAFNRATAGMKSPAKVIARTTGKTPEMAEKWLRGENLPSAEALIAACREFDDVWEEFKDLCGRADTEISAESILAEITARLKERRSL
jgi:transcriptional regulator with XRE-family HTH domain